MTGRNLNGLEIERLHGAAIGPAVPDLARLRIEVFHDFPYLYEGDFDYEQTYLQTYVKARTGTVVTVRDGADVVGASTALALEEESENVIAPFRAAGLDTGRIYYFGESVLRKGYRGRGIGVAFFEEREAAARHFGYSVTCFCGVVRPADHPLRPKDYVPLDDFWRHRGYRRMPELVAEFSWRDIGETRESRKPMMFWMKDLAP